MGIASNHILTDTYRYWFGRNIAPQNGDMSRSRNAHGKCFQSHFDLYISSTDWYGVRSAPSFDCMSQSLNILYRYNRLEYFLISSCGPWKLLNIWNGPVRVRSAPHPTVVTYPEVVYVGNRLESFRNSCSGSDLLLCM
jgi:hypothetical protein